ncbi:MAG: GNAT family N-acetyltransferase [Geminicoccaceae bacterium]
MTVAPPTLTTPRLALRPATEADLDALWRLLTDPHVRRYLCDDQVLTRAEVQEMLAASIAQWPAGMGFWILRDREEKLLGCIGLHPVTAGIVAHAPDLAGEIEPTIALAPDCWGCGYAAEALAAAVAHAFATLGLEQLVAVVDEPNARSHRLMLRVGFTPTGTTTTGPCYPLRTYRLAKPAFDARSVPRPP